MDGLKNVFIAPYRIAEVNSPGDFAYQRHGYVHQGIDIYCDDQTIIHAYESGTIINICNFTGEFADPPTKWWNNTKSILVEGESGVIGYCEIIPDESLTIGEGVRVGQPLGRVTPVLKKDKGNGTTMLHLELYKHGTKIHADWSDGEGQPIELLNPRVLLNQ